MGITKLSAEHVEYIIVRRYCQEVRINDIFKEVTEPRLEGESTNKYGITPIGDLSLKYFYQRVQRISQDQIDEVRKDWMADLMSIPLANKRVRVEKLVELMDETTDTRTRVKILKDIKEEIGEDAWLDAAKSAGHTTNVATGMTIDMIKQIAENVVAQRKEDETEDE